MPNSESWKEYRKRNPELMKKIHKNRYEKVKSDPVLLARVRKQQLEHYHKNKDRILARRKELDAEKKRLAAEAAASEKTNEEGG